MKHKKLYTTDPKYHCGTGMVLHMTAPGAVFKSGAVFKERKGYSVVAPGHDTGTVFHTFAWAKRILRKHLGGSW